jgi:hypothetical protein
MEVQGAESRVPPLREDLAVEMQTFFRLAVMARQVQEDRPAAISVDNLPSKVEMEVVVRSSLLQPPMGKRGTGFSMTPRPVPRALRAPVAEAEAVAVPRHVSSTTAPAAAAVAAEPAVRAAAVVKVAERVRPLWQSHGSTDPVARWTSDLLRSLPEWAAKGVTAAMVRSEVPVEPAERVATASAAPPEAAAGAMVCGGKLVERAQGRAGARPLVSWLAR